MNEWQQDIRRQVTNRARFRGLLLDCKPFIMKSGKFGKGKRIRLVWFEDDYVRYHALIMDDKNILAQVGGVSIEELNLKMRGWKHGSF